MKAIEVTRLCKTFEYYEKERGLGGSFRNLFSKKKLYKEAVKEVSFSVEQGEIVGLLGPNGAGKTTTMKMLSGILRPTRGSASVLGYTPWERKNEFRRQFSIVMGQKSQLWPDLPAQDSLWLMKCIYELSDADYQRTTGALIELLGVSGQLKTQVRRLSLGERMKFELIACLLYNPKMIFLDEPTIGLDIISQRTIRDFLAEYNKTHGVTIVITSHNVADIENLCDRVMVINHGKLVFDGSLSRVKNILGGHKQITLHFSSEVAEDELAGYGELRSFDKITATFAVDSDVLKDTAARMLSCLPVADITIEDTSLEEGLVSIYEN